MRILKNFYLYRRNDSNGIFYVRLKDKLTGKKTTAKSTGTRDRKEAEALANDKNYLTISKQTLSKRNKMPLFFTRK